MNYSLGFRRALLERLLLLATGTALTSTAAQAAGCGGDVTIDSDDEAAGVGGATGAVSSSEAATSVVATSAETATSVVSVASSSSSGDGSGGAPPVGCAPTDP